MTPTQRQALEAALRAAMKKAFNFGQTYWQQADSHFISQQNKSDIARESFNKLVNDTVRAALAKQATPEQEPAQNKFECWSSNDGDSWYESPDDAELVYEVLGDDPKVGDEYEVTAGWHSVTARYRITKVDEDGDTESECISHKFKPAPQPRQATPEKEPVRVQAHGNWQYSKHDGEDACGYCGVRRQFAKNTHCKPFIEPAPQPQEWQELSEKEKLDICVEADKAMENDPNLSWRNALINRTCAALRAKNGG